MCLEIIREIRKYLFLLNGNENTTYKNLRHAAMAILKGTCITEENRI